MAVLNLKNLTRWVVSVVKWAAEPAPVWLGIAVLLIALYFGFLFTLSEFSIKVSGLVLQILGIIYAIRGVVSVRSHFDLSPISQIVKSWIRRFPRWRPKVIGVAGQAQASSSAMSARAEVWAPDDPDASLHERINNIVNNLDRLRASRNQQAQEISNLKHTLTGQLDELREQVSSTQAGIEKRLESLHTHDLVDALIGLVWVMAGVILTTLAPELDNWLG